MESALGFEFSQVRIFTDDKASALADGLNARALTYGSNVLFSQSQYNPVSSEGRELLAHELIHVTQYANGCAPKTMATTESLLEHEASEGAKQVINGIRPTISRENAASLLCDEKETPSEEPAGKTIIAEPTHDTYTVKGHTLAEAAKMIMARIKAKNTGAGHTIWKPEPKPDLKFDKNNITVKATVNVAINITMPDWPDAEKLSAEAKAEWDRYYKALEDHEHGHVDLVNSEISGVAETLIGQSQANAWKAFNKAFQELNKKSDAYDKKTNHGENEGCYIDISIE